MTDATRDLRSARTGSAFPARGRDEYAALNGATAARTWNEAVRRVLAHVDPDQRRDWIGELAVDGRYAWKLLMRLGPGQALLDLGCGLGSRGSNLAPHVGRLVALDPSPERLRFARMRFSFCNPGDDITLVAGGDGPCLPFATGSFDAVVLSDTLVWAAVGGPPGRGRGSKLRQTVAMLAGQFGERNPRRLQLRLLREIRRILKPGGQLFIAAENRMAAGHFTGHADHYSRLKYAALMPRAAACAYSMLVRGTPYRTYTYSMRGYQRLLRQSGFDDIEFLAFSDVGAELGAFTPVGAKAALSAASAPLRIKQRLKRNRYLVPAYGMLAGASGSGAPCLRDQIFRSIERSAGYSSGALQPLQYLVTEKGKLLITGVLGDEPVMVRVPFGEGPSRSEACNYDMLQYMHPKLDGALRCPRPIASGSIDRIRYFVEERLPGDPLNRHVRRLGRERAATLAGRALADLARSAGDTLERLDGDLYQRVVGDFLQQLARIVDDAAMLGRLDGYFHKMLDNQLLRIGVCHGDFGSGNLLVSDDDIVGLVDWETGTRCGLPATDAVNYLISIGSSTADGGLYGAIRRIVSRAWPVASEWRLVEESFDRFGITPALHRPLVYLAWLSHVATVPSPFFAYDAQRVNDSIRRVADLIVESG